MRDVAAASQPCCQLREGAKRLGGPSVESSPQPREPWLQGWFGAKGGAKRPHINKKVTFENLMSAIEGIKSRKDRKDLDRLEKLTPELDKYLPKGVTVPVVNLTDKEEEEVEEKPKVTRSPGGKTFRRRRGETEMAESMTPADAILQSSAVSPDLDRALRLVKGIS